MEFNLPRELIFKILFNIGVFVALYGLAFILQKIINRRIKDIFRRHLLRKLAVYSALFISILFTVFFWIKNVTALSAIAGGLGAALILSLHKPLMKIFGWSVIAIRRLYTVGDRIEIGGLKGDVIDIRLFYTVLLEVGNWVEGEQSTGRIVFVPNDTVFSNNVFNYTYGFKYIWNEISFTITFDSNYKKAVDILYNILSAEELHVEKPVKSSIDKMANKYVIQFEKLTPYVWLKVVDHGIQLTMRYLADVWKRRITEQFISERVLERFNKEKDITLAYPTYTIHTVGKK